IQPPLQQPPRCPDDRRLQPALRIAKCFADFLPVVRDDLFYRSRFFRRRERIRLAPHLRSGSSLAHVDGRGPLSGSGDQTLSEQRKREHASSIAEILFEPTKQEFRSVRW